MGDAGNSEADCKFDISNVVLNVGIVGAGIAGLGTAIALRHAGHRVEVKAQLIAWSNVATPDEADTDGIRFSSNRVLRTKLARRYTSRRTLHGFCGVGVLTLAGRMLLLHIRYGISQNAVGIDIY